MFPNEISMKTWTTLIDTSHKSAASVQILVFAIVVYIYLFGKT